MPGTWYTSRAIFTDLVQDETKDKTYDESETVGISKIENHIGWPFITVKTSSCLRFGMFRFRHTVWVVHMQ